MVQKLMNLWKKKRKIKRMVGKTYWIHYLRLIKGELEKIELSLQGGEARRNNMIMKAM